MKNNLNDISEKMYFDLVLKGFMEKSPGTRETLLKFAQDFCSLIEIYGFRFQLIIFNKKNYEVNEAIKLIQQFNGLLNPVFATSIDSFFETEMEMTFFRGSTSILNLSDEGDYYQVRSKNPFHNDDYKFPKKDFSSYADKMYVSSNKKLLEKLRRFIELTRPKNDKNLNGVRKVKVGGVINKIEILENTGRIKVYINENYHNELDFSRGKSWGMLYELAQNKTVNFNKNFLDYFNSNKKNPLYAKHDFTMTKILKQEDRSIIPNIKIDLITKKKATQRLNSA